MLAKIFERADYDMYKETFVKELIQDEDGVKELIDDLVEIVKENLK